MSIEAMKLALEALETCRIRSVSEWSVEDITPKNVTAAIEALRTAIQQAEAQQPATGEPAAVRNPFAARCYTMSESHLSGHRLIVGFEKLGDVQDAHEWVARQARGDFTHPEPGVPADAVRDAERYRFIRDADVSDDLIPDIALYAMESLDEYIDAAMLSAKDTK